MFSIFDVYTVDLFQKINPLKWIEVGALFLEKKSLTR